MTLFDVVNPIIVNLKQFFCNHKDVSVIRECGRQTFRVTECVKCGRIRVKEL